MFSTYNFPRLESISSKDDQKQKDKSNFKPYANIIFYDQKNTLLNKEQNKEQTDKKINYGQYLSNDEINFIKKFYQNDATEQRSSKKKVNCFQKEPKFYQESVKNPDKLISTFEKQQGQIIESCSNSECNQSEETRYSKSMDIQEFKTELQNLLIKKTQVKNEIKDIKLEQSDQLLEQNVQMQEKLNQVKEIEKIFKNSFENFIQFISFNNLTDDEISQYLYKQKNTNFSFDYFMTENDQLSDSKADFNNNESSKININNKKRKFFEINSQINDKKDLYKQKKVCTITNIGRYINPYKAYLLRNGIVLDDNCLNFSSQSDVCLNLNYTQYKNLDFITKSQNQEILGLYLKDKPGVYPTNGYYLYERYMSFGRQEYKELAEKIMHIENNFIKQQDRYKQLGQQLSKNQSGAELIQNQEKYLESLIQSHKGQPVKIVGIELGLKNQQFSNYQSLHVNKEFLQLIGWNLSDYEKEVLKKELLLDFNYKTYINEYN